MRSARWIGTIMFMAVCGLAAAQPALATCGSAQCFIAARSEDGLLQKGAIGFNLSFDFVPQSRRLEGRDQVREVLTPKIDFEGGTIEPDHHREISTRNLLVRLELAYGVGSRWTLAAALPIVNQRDHEHFDHVGEPEEFFTRQDGASGFGDVRLGVRHAFLQRPKNRLSGTVFLKAPTGDWRLRDSEGGINEPTIQPGSGSWDWIASADYGHDWVAGRHGFFVTLLRRVNAGNDLDYEFGDETQAGFGVQARAGDRVVWMGQINLRRTDRDRFRGETVPATGSTLVNLTPGVRLESPRGGAVTLHVAVPIYQDVNEAQLAPGVGVMLGFTHTF